MKAITSCYLFYIIMLNPLISNSQLVSISGNITNVKSGIAIENVSVYESLKKIGTISNENGFYKLLLKPGETKLIFSSNGFNEITNSFVLKADTILKVKLEPAESKNRHNVESELRAEAKANNSLSKRRARANK